MSQEVGFGTSEALDTAVPVRVNEGLDEQALWRFLEPYISTSMDRGVLQFPRGHSNLTYLLKIGEQELVLRRPPFGANVPTGHDMGREYRILTALYPHWPKVPKPVCYCDDPTVIGAPFYVMERVSGVILRTPDHPGLSLTRKYMETACQTLVTTLVEVHALVPAEVGLADLGRPEGYIKRQIDGWSRRYLQAKTHDIDDVEKMGRWLSENLPAMSSSAVIHNDYKYDNLVLSITDPGKAIAVLDWEMCTLGDPLMDLGTTLAYWVDPTDPVDMRALPFGPTVLPGNYTREALVNAYSNQSGRCVDDCVFYYVYGLFKVAGIAQQIYARYHHGVTKDRRFAMMIDAVRMMGRQGSAAIRTGRISDIAG